jgi:signal recognition particle receptor subunit beta
VASTASNGATDTHSVKVLISGPVGVGKTTLITVVNSGPPTTTELLVPQEAGAQDGGGMSASVSMEFGRVSLDRGLDLFLFSTPGQDRFHFFWDDLARGALAAAVLVDTRRLDASFGALGYFEDRDDIPITVLVNRIDGELTHTVAEIREALALPDHVPLLDVDVRNRGEVLVALRATLAHAFRRKSELANPLGGESA